MKNARRVCALIVSALALTAAIGAAPVSGAPFPCRWKWDLEAGLRNGYVTAGNSADCSGRPGSLTLSARLLRWNPQTKRWHTDKAQTRTWTNLSGNRYLVLNERCVTSTVRAVFDWTLRGTGGAVVGHRTVRTALLKVPGPDCRIRIG